MEIRPGHVRPWLCCGCSSCFHQPAPCQATQHLCSMPRPLSLHLHLPSEIKPSPPQTVGDTPAAFPQWSPWSKPPSSLLGTTALTPQPFPSLLSTPKFDSYFKAALLLEETPNSGPQPGLGSYHPIRSLPRSHVQQCQLTFSFLICQAPSSQ